MRIDKNILKKMFVLKTLERFLLRTKQNVKCYSSGLNTMENPIVTVKQGKLKGSIQKLVDDTPYYSFKGVPYAQPPVGELRFRAPLPPKSWEGIREAIEHGPVCPQFDMTTADLIEGSEDCLFLNVYTRTLQSNVKKPVMVYVHGGGYMSGSGDTDVLGPEFLLQHDVVVVTMNYRLEVLGFLCLDTAEVPGNAGMKDQVAALRWVQHNIDQFGGNPDNVTLFGESAGSASVTYHMLSPMSKGLFHKAIAQSGVCTQDWALISDAKERAFRSSKLLGKETNDTQELLDFFRSLPALSLAKLTFKTRTEDEKYRGLPMYFVPVVEKQFDNVESFLSENPIDMILNGKMHKVPLLLGYNSAEGLLMLDDQLKKAGVYNNRPSNFVPRGIMQRVSREKLEEFGRRIKSFYFGDKGLSNETSEALVNMQTDLFFSYHTHLFAYFYSSYAPVYLYRFNYATELNVFKNLLGLQNMKGMSHADDLFYLFYNQLNSIHYNDNEKLKQIVFRVTKYWTDFAKTGNPTPGSCDVEWKRYSPSGKEYMALEDTPYVGNCADKDRVDFWNKLYSEAGLPSIAKSNI